MSGLNKITNGMEPQGPFALTSLPSVLKDRCVNLKDFWTYPTDLTKIETIRHLFQLFDDIVQLLISDMEPMNQNMFDVFICI